MLKFKWIENLQLISMASVKKGSWVCIFPWWHFLVMQVGNMNHFQLIHNTFFDEQAFEWLRLVSLCCNMEESVASLISFVEQLWQTFRSVQYLKKTWGIVHQCGVQGLVEKILETSQHCGGYMHKSMKARRCVTTDSKSFVMRDIYHRPTHLIS